MRRGLLYWGEAGKTVGVLISLLLLISCGATQRDDLTGSGASTTTILNTPSVISLSTDVVAVKSDNSDSATITASVLNGNNAPVSGIPVSFSSDGGQISATSVKTDSNGQASIKVSSGTVDKTNATRSITASVTGLTPTAIPIQVTGTTVTITGSKTSITDSGSEFDTISIAVKDAGGIGIYNATVSLAISGTGTATLSSSTATTDASGTVSNIKVTGTGAGAVTLSATALGTSASRSYTVASSGTAFSITSPTSESPTLSTTGSLTVTVSAPSSSNVVFASTVGVWDGGALKQLTKAVAGGTASAVLTSPSNTGTANITVYDAANPSTSDTLTVYISAPSSSAANIDLQSDVSVLQKSSDTLKYTADLTATVRTTGNLVVGGATVAFSIVNPTGGGEIVSPVVVQSSSSGVATATFTSGLQPSGSGGVQIKAEVVGTAISDTLSIVIGGTAGSVVIGQSTGISTNSTNTAYIYPMSVLVSDANGNPMSGTTVTLSVWPLKYKTDGTRDGVVGTFTNEDVNENLIFDTGEDLNGDGELTPPNSAAGSLPSTVITDTTGMANFNFVYLKSSSRWITARIKALVMVQGTETKSTLIFTLPASQGDISAGTLPTSPYFAPLTTGVPYSISLSGAKGATVSSALLTPLFGTGPYTFTATSGTMTPSSGLSSTYSYTISSGATSGSTITDTITITDSGAQPSSVTINVSILVL